MSWEKKFIFIKKISATTNENSHAPINDNHAVDKEHQLLYLLKVKRVPHLHGPNLRTKTIRCALKTTFHARCNCARPFSSRARFGVFLIKIKQPVNWCSVPRLTKAFPSSMRSVVSSSDWRNCAKPIEERQRVPSLKYVPVQSSTIKIGK